MSAKGGGYSDASMLAEIPLRTVFQPLVDIASRRIVGYEALVRGPEGSEWASPAALFGAARRAGALSAFDRRCRDLAMDTATAAGLRAPQTLFLNVEASALPGGRAGAHRRPEPAPFPLVLEVTERECSTTPPAC